MSQQDVYLVEELRSNKTIEDNFGLLQDSSLYRSPFVLYIDI